MRQGLTVVLVLVLVLGLYMLDRSQLWLGHPIWSPLGIVIGVVIAALSAAILPANARWQGVMALFFAGVAGYLSAAGKADFAASYAEDALAGRYWFFGYQAMLYLAAFGLVRLARSLSK
ncbi:MAG: hypothetical protein WD046_00950 [Paracoccaceae bacterium]